MPNSNPAPARQFPDSNHRKPAHQEISAGVIVFRRTKEGPVFLVLYNGGDYWNFPKGKIEESERSIEAAIRETCEETGIDAGDMRLIRDFRTQEHFTFRRDRRTIAKTIIFYLAETRKMRVRLAEKTYGERHQGYGWFPYKEAVRILGKYRESQRVIKEAYDFLCKKSAHHRRPHSPGQNPHLSGGGQNGGKPPSLPRGREHS